MRRRLPGETRKLSHYIKPMLARETEKAFDDKDWIFEIKWDGYRAIAEITSKEIKLYSRNGNTFNASYPIIAQELKKIKTHAVLDGEITVTDEKGNPSFQLLQDYESNKHLPIYYYVFDLLSIKGKDISHLPLLERKKLLKELLPKNDIIKYSDHIVEKGKDFFSLIKKRNMEGIMAKKADGEYYPGKRTKEWLKIKNHLSQEAIIAGFTKPAGSRKYFGALVLGIMQGDELKYAGHTGTGFNQQTLKEVSDLLKPLIQKDSPFKEDVKTNMPVTWVKPKLVCEIKLTEMTSEGRMRHPVFLHLRPDKNIKDVTMESTKTISKKEAEKTPKENDKIYSYGKIRVSTTNDKKIYWPDEGITKGDVIEYYNSVADYILPYLKDRPQSLKRNPNGIQDPGFFQKDAGGAAPSWVKHKKIFSDSVNKKIDYILCNNHATLTYMNNLGCIEINPWHSTIQKLDNPDYLIIDIDPSPKNSFNEVIEAALIIHEVLKKAKAPNFCKTSGASGMHVYVPMEKKYTYEQVKYFAELICRLTNEQLPEFTSLVRNLKKRGPKMYLDHLQNRRGQTIASVYSLRPYPGATVSMPLQWKEVKKGLSPSQFDIFNTPKRLKKTGDIFSGVLGKGIDIKKCLKELGE